MTASDSTQLTVKAVNTLQSMDWETFQQLALGGIFLWVLQPFLMWVKDKITPHPMKADFAKLKGEIDKVKSELDALKKIATRSNDILNDAMTAIEYFKGSTIKTQEAIDSLYDTKASNFTDRDVYSVVKAELRRIEGDLNWWYDNRIAINHILERTEEITGEYNTYVLLILDRLEKYLRPKRYKGKSLWDMDGDNGFEIMYRYLLTTLLARQISVAEGTDHYYEDDYSKLTNNFTEHLMGMVDSWVKHGEVISDRAQHEAQLLQLDDYPPLNPRKAAQEYIKHGTRKRPRKR
jgi:hypothetical protein